MEKKTDSFPGTKKANLKMSFKQFSAAFSRFSGTEQMQLHRLFIQVITSLHENIEDEFESFCLETQVDNTLDSAEQLIEEFNMNPLFSDWTNLKQTGEELLVKKKNEIQHLKQILEKAEESKTFH